MESVGFNPRTWILLPSIKKQSNASENIKITTDQKLNNNKNKIKKRNRDKLPFVKIEHLFQKKKKPKLGKWYKL